MKGPGLPGFRKQVGRGFYKSPGFDINTSNRSPMKEGEEGDKKLTQDEIAKRRKALLDCQNDPNCDESKIVWEKEVSDSERIISDNNTILQTSKSQEGFIPGQEVEDVVKPGEPGYEKWFKAYTKAKEEGDDSFGAKYRNTEVYRGNTDIEVIEPKKDVEWTNFKLSYGISKTGMDNNDNSARYTISGNKESGTIMNGELSRNDIEQKVKDGVFKYEVDSQGKPTGNLLMSKDYHENTYTPMVEMYEKGKENYNAYFDARGEWMTNARKEMHAQLTEEFGNNKKSKAYKQKFKELNDARIQEGVELNYLTGGRNNRKGTDIDESATAGAGNFTYGGDPGAYPDFMRGNPNYGLMHPSIVNDDEVEPNTGFKKGVKNNQKINGELLQGHRLQDWEWDDELGKAVLKEDAITMTDEEWSQLSAKEKQTVQDTDMINAAGQNLKPKDGYRDENGNWVAGAGVTRRETNYDNLLTNKRSWVKTENGIESQNTLDKTSALGKTDWFKHNLNLGSEEHRSTETMDDPTLATEVTESEAEYSAEDLVKIEEYNKIKNQ